MAEMMDAAERSSRWRTAMRGPLPPDFLRVDMPRDMMQEQMNAYQASNMVYAQMQQQYVAPNHVGRLSITCAQARLARNYGITRMDPYVRIRVGHYVYETQTDPNGGKNPRWNRVIQSQLANGVHSIYVEIYDECSFKMDELIAWCEIKLPENVMRGETHEEWYPLSGKQGDGLEGAIDIVLSFSNQPIQPYMLQTVNAHHNIMMVPPGRPMPIFVTPTQPQVPQQQQLQQQMPVVPQQPIVMTEEDFKQFHEMFPNIDREVVKSIFEANGGNKEITINALLQLNE